MFVVSKRNIILPGPDGEKFHMPKDYMGPIPAWAEDSAYLKALAADGKVIISDSGTDKEFSAGEKNPRRNGKGKNAKKAPEKEPEKDTEGESKSEDSAPEDQGDTEPEDQGDTDELAE